MASEKPSFNITVHTDNMRELISRMVKEQAASMLVVSKRMFKEMQKAGHDMRNVHIQELMPTSPDYTIVKPATHPDNLVDWMANLTDDEVDLIRRMVNNFGDQHNTTLGQGHIAFLNRPYVLEVLEGVLDNPDDAISRVYQEPISIIISKLTMHVEWMDITSIGDPGRRQVHVITKEERLFDRDRIDVLDYAWSNKPNYNGDLFVPKVKFPKGD